MKPSGTWERLAEALIGSAELTTVEVAREAGVDPAQARRLWRALGFPPVAGDERLFARSDVEILRAEVMFAVADGAFAADIAIGLVEAHARDTL